MTRDAITAVVRQVAAERRGTLSPTHPLHPYNSPDWFAGVQRSIPGPAFARLCGQIVRSLVFEQAAAAQWRAARAFTGT